MSRRHTLIQAKIVRLCARVDEAGETAARVPPVEAVARLYLELGSAESALEYLYMVDEKLLSCQGLQYKARALYHDKQYAQATTVCKGLVENNRVKFTRQLEYSIFAIYSRLLRDNDQLEAALCSVEDGIEYGIPDKSSSVHGICAGCSIGSLLLFGASLCRQLRRPNKALDFLEHAHLERAHCLAPYSFAHVWLEVGQVYEESGQNVFAEAAMNICRRMVSESLAHEFQRLAKVYLTQEDTRAADACLRQAEIRFRSVLEAEDGRGQEDRIEEKEQQNNIPSFLSPKLRFRRKRFEAFNRGQPSPAGITRPSKSRTPRKVKLRGHAGNEIRSKEPALKSTAVSTSTQTSLGIQDSFEEDNLSTHEDADVKKAEEKSMEVGVEDYSMDDFNVTHDDTASILPAAMNKKTQATSGPVEPALEIASEPHAEEGASAGSVTDAESHLYNSEDERALLSPPVEMELEKMFSENPELLDTTHLFETNSFISDFSFDANKFDLDLGKTDPLFEKFLVEDVGLEEEAEITSKQPTSGVNPVVMPNETVRDESKSIDNKLEGV